MNTKRVLMKAKIMFIAYAMNLIICLNTITMIEN